MQEEQYRAIEAISQSSLKDWKTLPPIEWKKVWIDKTKERKVTDSLKLGSLVDALLFSPETVDERFVSMEANKPSASITFIIDKIAESHDIAELNLEKFKDEIISYAKVVPMPEDKVGWGQGKGWSDDRVFNTVIKDGEDYFNFLKTTNGKCVLTAGEYMDALNMAEIIRTNPISAKYLVPDNNEFQFEIVTNEALPRKRKGLLDILHIDNKEKTLQIVDFKTAESAFYFVGNIYRFGYLDQVAFYYDLLRYWLAHIQEGQFWNGYTILPPINLVIDKSYKTPYIYEYNYDDINATLNGYTKNKKKVKGVYNHIDDIAWHIINDKWEAPREMYEQGKISLNLINID